MRYEGELKSYFWDNILLSAELQCTSIVYHVKYKEHVNIPGTVHGVGEKLKFLQSVFFSWALGLN